MFYIRKTNGNVKMHWPHLSLTSTLIMFVDSMSWPSEQGLTDHDAPQLNIQGKPIWVLGFDT